MYDYTVSPAGEKGTFHRPNDVTDVASQTKSSKDTRRGRKREKRYILVLKNPQARISYNHRTNPPNNYPIYRT